MQKKIGYIIFLFIIYSGSFAQNKNILFTPLTYHFQNISTDSALNIIEKNINYYFIYNSELLSDKTLITTKFTNYPLSIILDSLFNNPFLNYKILRKQIVIYKNETTNDEFPKQTGIKQYKTISGSILDNDENTPLPFSSISIFNKATGTICNLDGEFNINISEEHFADTLLISHLGYEPYLMSISKATPNITIKLLKKIIPLQEILIRWRDPKELLINALLSVKENYSRKHAQIRAFYRESLQRNNKYMFYSEGILDLYKNAYRPTLFNDQARLLQLRKFSNIDVNDSILIKLQGGVNASLELDLIRNPLNFISLDKLNLFDYHYEGIESINDVIAHTIRFEPNTLNEEKDYTGTIYIDTKSLAIISIQFKLIKQNARNAAKSFVVKSQSGIKVLPKNITYKITYKKNDNQYHIYHVVGDLHLKIKRKRNFFSSIYKIHFEMLTTDILTTGVERFKNDDRLKSKQILSDIDHNYIDNINEYWGINNFILPENDLLKAMSKFKAEELNYLDSN